MITNFPNWLGALIPLVVTLFIVVSGLAAVQFWMKRNQPANPDARLPRQLAIVGCYVLAALMITLALPISETTRGQVLSLAGLVITALIALSSTTLVANAMAGVLLRMVDSFQPGDFIRVGDHFGRVSERGLFHTEIQTEDRDLMTLPNMHLITNPVTVVHDTGTIVSASLSLGYDLHHKLIEKHLKLAANNAQLSDPFVQIRELGDYSVVYRIAGKLEDVNSLITARSRLRACVLDELHEAGIEIVSPSFMNQRPQTNDNKIIPKTYREARRIEAEATNVEGLVFDKAEQASQDQQRRNRIDELQKLLVELKSADKENNPQRNEFQAELDLLQATEESADTEKT